VDQSTVSMIEKSNLPTKTDVLYRIMDSLKLNFFFEEIMWIDRSLDHKYKKIFKCKRN
jgi:hypothetical protein